ncbi:hypothetical protein [Neobacillus sp. OS1-33]|uniref:hypothetical protein n=1 Tax=Neobacillus sp. OS1-33 TaxID=3070683 RepID=UPI0027DFE9DE|nr:hypothetical protein [Neobacillus sp. OS1-33]WML24400.1 hypothetical protein RCG22_16030 [Neobacillus sp. OS1-33]
MVALFDRNNRIARTFAVVIQLHFPLTVKSSLDGKWMGVAFTVNYIFVPSRLMKGIYINRHPLNLGILGK